MISRRRTVLLRSLLLMPRAGDMVVASLDDHISKWQIQDFPPEILDSPEIAAHADFIQLLKSAMASASLRANALCAIRLRQMGADAQSRSVWRVWPGALEACLIIPIHKPCLIQILSGQ